jgi:hypothetical protein
VTRYGCFRRREFSFSQTEPFGVVRENEMGRSGEADHKHIRPASKVGAKYAIADVGETLERCSSIRKEKRAKAARQSEIFQPGVIPIAARSFSIHFPFTD